MESITKNEIRVILELFKNFSVDYNATSLSKRLDMTPMGALKILKKLESERILKSKKYGKAVFYKIDFENPYTKSYIAFLLQKESQQSNAKIKRWIKDIKKFENCAEIAILFGSVIKNTDYKDVDILIITKEIKKIRKIEEEINKVTNKKLHIIKQTEEDLVDNIKKRDRIILNIINTGIVLFGHEKLVGVLKNVSR